MTAKSTGKPYTILHTESSLGWGGQERRILVEAEAMQSRGHRLLIACDPRGELYLRARQDGFAVVPLAFGGWRNLTAWLSLRPVLRDRQVDILNTHSSLDSWVGWLAWRTLGTRPLLVRTRHLSTPVRSSWPTRMLYQAPAAVITTAGATKEYLARQVQVPPQRLFSIPTGVSLTDFPPLEADADMRQRLQIPDKAFIFGMVAVLRSWKGHLYLLEALRELIQGGSPAFLVLVGEGPQRGPIEKKMAELALQPWVRLAGYQDQVAPWLALMDVVVLPSYANEGVPQALLQAMAMAKPVVGANVGGIPEIVIDGETGLLVEPRDPPALAQAIKRLREHPEMGRELGRKARGMVMEKFSLAQMAAAVEEVYDLVGGWRRDKPGIP